MAFCVVSIEQRCWGLTGPSRDRATLLAASEELTGASCIHARVDISTGFSRRRSKTIGRAYHVRCPAECQQAASRETGTKHAVPKQDTLTNMPNNPTKPRVSHSAMQQVDFWVSNLPLRPKFYLQASLDQGRDCSSEDPSILVSDLET